MQTILGRTMRDSQFYPTPAKLIKDIIEELARSSFLYDQPELNFLEPCAGDGAICREIKEFAESKEDMNINIECIEIEPILRDSLKGKGYNVIADDFELFQGIPFYDLIIMNPPFAKGAKFLLKAYDLLSANGKLICILNAETIKNVCSKDRELLKNLIERVGEVEFKENAFTDAEHATDVEIVVVHLTKPHFENEFNIFGDIHPEILTEDEKLRDKIKEQVTSGELMHFDKVDQAIRIYRNSVKQTFKGIDAIQEIKSGMAYLETEAQEFNIKPEEFMKILLEENQEDAKDKTIKLIRKMVWSYILKFSDMDQYLFTKHKADFYNQLDKGSASLPFTKENISQFFANIFLKRTEYFKKGVQDLFEEITSYHNGNTRHQEGWKTNKNWKINKKIIVDWGITFEKWSDTAGEFSISYHGHLDWLKDLDKVVRKIKPKGYGDDQFIEECLRERFHDLGYIKPRGKFDNTVETPYFNIKFFKKGSLHITFKDDEILAELNLMGARLRTDLGYDDFGKKETNE